MGYYCHECGGQPDDPLDNLMSTELREAIIKIVNGEYQLTVEEEETIKQIAKRLV
jgi:hypothetical protein